MKALIEAINSKDLVKAKKVFAEMMEDIKKGLVEAEKKVVGSSIEEDNSTENPDDESEDDSSTKNKVDSSKPDDSTQAA